MSLKQTRIGVSQRPKWRITVLSADGMEQIFHASCEDFKEVQCLATEARSASLDYQIYWSRPATQEAISWD